MNTKKIAIIGGGGSGVVAAWALHKKHDISLFEAESNLGGHAYSHTLNLKEGEAHIDMGVEYFNRKISPNFCALLKLLEIESFIAPLSFRSCFEKDDTCWSNVNVSGELRAALNDEFERFHSEMEDVIESDDELYKNISIGDFLKENNYSSQFIHKALYPLMTIYLGCNAPVEEYNLMYVAFSFHMNFLSLFSSGYWLKVKGGISKYIEVIEEELKDKIHLNARIEKVIPTDNGVELLLNRKTLSFDAVVFATHADITLKLLTDSSPIYKRFLGKFEYAPVESYMHTDGEIINKENDDEYFEFSMPAAFDLEENKHQSGSLTRIYNNLLDYHKFEDPLLVTFDPYQTINPEKIKAERSWKLPKLRPEDFQRRQNIHHIQGKNNCWFCGTDTSLTGHEGAIVSGLVIAEQLGVEHAFKNHTAAHNHFNTIKTFMGFKTSQIK